MRTWKKVLIGGTAVMGGSIVLCIGAIGPCWTSWIGDAVLLDECPVGDLRPVALVEAHGLGRKDEGSVEVGLVAHYANEWGGYSATQVRRFSPSLALVAPDGTVQPLGTVDGWEKTWGTRKTAQVKLPEGPDGDYILRVTVGSPAGDATVDAPLPLYQPALAHVLTDAPLYKPGQEVKFRAVLLGAADLAPLEGRPGTWKVWDPSGELLLEEKGKTGAFGVVSGSFPLTSDATSGAWAVAFESGAATDRVTVDVKPFQLPRFTVEAKSARPAWRIGEAPVVEGTARYTSGAPLANVNVRVTARGEGEWPPPPAWLLERALTTDAKGAFRIEVAPDDGVVPADLRGQATIRYTITATDDTGDTAIGGAAVLLAEDPITADAVTELAGGLVPSANNRVYLRVATAEGRVLPGATVRVTREWDPSDPGLEATADADGVARFQLDPGEPTTVVVPAMPVRPRPRQAVVAVSLSSAVDVLADESVDLEGRVALDRWTNKVRACADRVPVGEERGVDVSALIGADGRVRQAEAFVGSTRSPLSRCVAGVLAGESGPRGRDRLWNVSWRVRDPGTPSFSASLDGVVGDLSGVDDAVTERLLDARACAAALYEGGELPRAFRVRVDAGSTAIALTPIADPSSGGEVPAGVVSCVERFVYSGLRLEDAADDAGAGLLRITASVPVEPGESQPGPTTFPGFALKVQATVDGEPLGATVLRMPVGAVPTLRLRFSEVIVDPGAKVELTAVRGPDFTGSFPEKLWLRQGDRSLVEFPFDEKTRKATVTVPADIDGFVHVEWSGAKAVLYVRPKSDLALVLTTDAATYRPGDTANVTLTARDGDTPVAAGVTLSGVDSTLATLAALPNPDAFARVTVRATSDAPAFGVLDARALQTGQIAGDNAAQAAVLRVTGLPTLPPGADRVSIAETSGAFTPDAELADAFYVLYRHARTEVRAWESATPAGDVLTAETMVKLWEKALRAHPTEDPFGRPLHLSTLPGDLLALTDPRFMASDGARLPEDVENWPVYVSAEAP
ncbi:MAG: MG2 domain-containing protein [Pseudomonadota bacterium]|nr:MG2 domain-containing protein [Pseudomonadota bacterium]